MKNFKRIALYTLLFLLVVIIYVGYSNYPKLEIISGFAAKNMCSCMFIDNRSLEYTANNDNNFSPIHFAENKVDPHTKATTARVFSLKPRTAIYREGLGCVLIPEHLEAKSLLTAQKPVRAEIHGELPYPYGSSPQKDTVFTNLNYQQIQQTVDEAFKNNHTQKTRSVLVIYKDQIIAERYADSLDRQSKLLGWSMTKSVLATLYGILTYERDFQIKQPAKVKSWKNDQRAKITYGDLFHMNSGLEWEEDYSEISDVTKMLFQVDDMSKIQEEKEAKHPPNTHFNYSSGTTNLLSGLLRNEFESYNDYLNFPYKKLIDRIGMHSMILETDAAGNFVGSSYGWATTRDWGKFGLLYLHKGNWNGDQIFDKQWVDFVTTPAANSNNQYGGHFWLNTSQILPGAPMDTYYADGFQGQRVYIVPSKDLVVVRMGLASTEYFDFNAFLSGITEAID